MHISMPLVSIMPCSGPRGSLVRCLTFVRQSNYEIIPQGNFLTVPSIKTNDELTSATGKGRIGLISEDDIADVAVDLLTASKLGGAEPTIVGPELLSYDDVQSLSC